MQKCDNSMKWNAILQLLQSRTRPRIYTPTILIVHLNVHLKSGDCTTVVYEFYPATLFHVLLTYQKSSTILFSMKSIIINADINNYEEFLINENKSKTTLDKYVRDMRRL